MQGALNRRARAAVAVAAAAFTVLAGVVAGERPASAADDYPLPAAGAYTVSGHGYGHGRGMSQWGAYGMATEGRTAAQILDFYYPGTQHGTIANQPVRVLLKRSGGANLTVRAAAGQWLIDDGHAGQKTSLPTSVGGVAVEKWKAERAGSQIALSGWWSGAWHAYPTAAPLVTSGPVTFGVDSGTQRMIYPDNSENEYEGTLSGVLDGSALLAISSVPMESYLKGVVPHETPSTWPAAAIQAQAIAARTFAAARLGGALYDICDDVACQAYTGVATYSATGVKTPGQSAQANAAIAATAGQTRTYAGVPISAQYSSSDGGWTVDAGVPYKPAQPDPWDSYSPYHDWTATLAESAIEAAFPSIGVLGDISIGSRDGNGDFGGRVLSLTLTGSAGSQTVTGEAFRLAMGLRSDWFTFGDAAESTPTAGYLHPLNPARILDTRQGGTPFGSATTRTVQVAGLGGVPSDAIGVVLNVTATDTTGTSYLTVWPTPGARPNTSNLNWDRAGQTVANLVYSKLGPDGSVQIYNNNATASVIVDVFGYFATSDVSGGLGFKPLAPQRILDTRYGIGGPLAPIAAGTSRTLAVAGTAGVDPAAQAAITNLTVTHPTAESYLTMWPAGTTMPATSNINMLPRDTRANAALAVLGSGGALSLYNNRGDSDAIIDVLGEYVPADGTTGLYAGIEPSRLLDTRTTNGGHPAPLAPGETFALQVLGRGGVPASGVSAVVLNVTAVAPTAPTYVTVWSGAAGRPGISNLNAGKGTVVPNLAVAGVGPDGKVHLYNDQGSANLVVDVVGWISG